jgi:hypothetical protein
MGGMRETSEGRRQQFVRGLYFDLQRIDGVKPLEIWNGVREFFDPYEKAILAKNLYKVALPLVNEAFFGRPFAEHAAAARAAVEETAAWFVQSSGPRLFERFPDPPVGEGAEKDVYRVVRERLRERVRARAQRGADGASPVARGEDKGPRIRPAETMFPDGLFDFREMRIVDNEMPYIIFTDKEFRVIHGLAVVYLWLIDLDAIFCDTLGVLGGDPALVEEYRAFVRSVHRENPLTVKGKKMDARELSAHIHEKLQYEDYLDLFENVYRWVESVREKLGGR